MNIVYKITFLERKENNTPPYYYIGSKSNCEFVSGKIYESNGKEYTGSSRYKDYKKIVNESTLLIEIIETFDNYDDAIKFEYEIQKELNVIKSNEYFNLSMASQSSYNRTGYGTYKHKDNYDKKVKLRTDDHKVLDGTFIGATKNNKISEETKQKISLKNKGENNSFYGKTHSEETKQKISLKNKGNILSKETKQKMSESRKGVAKTEDHKLKIGRKNMIMLKNLDTGESIRIDKNKKDKYDEKWVNSFTYKSIMNPEQVKGKSNLVNKITGEKIRINTDMKSDYDSSIWISPQAYSKLIKGK